MNPTYGMPEVLSSQNEILVGACGLLDRSESGKLALTGSAARGVLQGQVTNDVEALTPGTGCYAALLTNKGKMLCDLRVLDAGEEVLLLCERSGLQELFNALRRGLVGFDAELHKRTVQRGLLSLIGPEARAVADAHDLPAEEHAHRAGEIARMPVRFVVTDLGVDVLCRAEDTEAVTAALVERGARPVDEDAVEIVRVESGRPRFGRELGPSVIPEEAGLNERAVSYTKGCYVGQETVARLHWRGKPNRHLRGLRLSAPAQPGDALRLGEKEVGRVASTVVSPRLGPIALALVRREAEPGSELAVGDGATAATVVTLPFAA